MSRRLDFLAVPFPPTTTTRATPPSPPITTAAPMSLLTPPHSSQKENSAKFSFSLSLNVDVPKVASSSTSTSTPSSASRNVVWSPHNSYHSLNAPAKPPPSAATTNAWVKQRPVRSILKQRRTTALADSTNSAGPSSASPADVSNLKNFSEDLDTVFRMREATPEPSDPLCDLNYLVYPVSLILKDAPQPRELIEGYSILAARLRTTVLFKTDADASWPLFQPLRKQADAFVKCVVRDLGRALIDPIKTLACPSSDQEEDAMKEWQDEEETSGLPSPEKSPRKPKKRGMTANQVKYARDLCTISHAAIKLLCIMFAVPATYSVFEDKQLKSILNAALAIPVADSLPTPNARKTCALVILLLQCQRLPQAVVLPARDRIALALKRGISGELGKEGKKGSANDGLKAVHDLSVFQPAVFVPAFASGIFLRSILQNLLASTLNLRVQACHALGGLSYALASLPPSSLHATVSDIVIDFLTTPSPPTPTKPGKLSTPLLALRDSLIIRTLRTTMNTSDATHIAQSSVWGMSVISSLILLVGSRMYTNKKACQTLMNVLKIGLKSKKSSIRNLFGMAWRTLTWAWFQPDYDFLQDDGEEEKTEPDDDVEDREQQRNASKTKTREAYFQLLHEVVDMQAGLTTAVALLNCSPPSTANAKPHDGLRRTLSILQAMANSSNPDTLNDAVLIVVNMIAPSSSSSPRSDDGTSSAKSTHAILPRGLFSSHPTLGLLAADLSVTTGPGCVMNAVRPLFDQLPNVDEVRALTRDEITQGWVWSKLCKVWRTVIGSLEIPETVETPEELSRIWEALVVAGLGVNEEDGDGEFVERIMDVLIDMLEDKALDFTIKEDEVAVSSSPAASSSTSKIPFPSSNDSDSAAAQLPGKHTKHELKFKFVKVLLSTVRAVMTKEQLAGKPLSKLFACLTSPKNVSEWTEPRSRAAAAPRKRQRASSLSPWKGIPEMSSQDGGAVGKGELEPIRGWASLVATVMSMADGDAASSLMKAFWDVDREGVKDEDQSLVAGWNAEVKSAVWKTVVNSWKKNEGCWEGAVALLAAPFACGSKVDGSTWSLSADELTRWKELHEYATGKALDYGMDSASIVDGVAEIILASKDGWISEPREASSPVSTPGSSSSGSPSGSNSGLAASLIQISDLLLEHLDISEVRDLPMSLVSLVSDTLKVSYPPSPRNISPATWLIQALTRVVEHCPGSLVSSLAEALCDSLSVWLGDEHDVWTADVLDYTFLPLYQHILLRVQTFSKNLDFLETVSILLDSVFSGRTMPPSVASSFREAFTEFWIMSPYSKMDEPAGGWPKKIRHCLGLEDVVEEEEELAVPVTPTLVVFPEIGTFVPVTPKRLVNRKMDGGAPRTPMAAMNGSSHIPSPHRPQKDHLDSHVPFPLPVYSPVSPVRRRRRTSSSTSVGSLTNGRLNVGLFRNSGMLGIGLEAASPIRPGNGESPAKRRRVNSGEVGDKENASPSRRGTGSLNSSPVRIGNRISAPLFEVVSVADRIAAVSVTVSGPSESGQGGGDKTEGRTRRKKMRERMTGKKQKRDVSPAGSVVSTCSTSSARSSKGSESEDDEKQVEGVLVPFPSLEPGQPQEEEVEAEQTIVVKKRKRTFMESVMIPPLARAAPRKRKLEHAASFESAIQSSSSSAPTSSSSTLLPPAVTMESLRTPPIAKRSFNGLELAERTRRKRKRSLSVTFDAPPQSGTNVHEDPFEIEVSTSTSLPALRFHPAPSEEDDSQDEKEIAEVPSSDDDPRFGQVTPHHILSPSFVQRPGKVYVSRMKRSVSESGLGHVAFQESDDDDLMMCEPGSSPSKKVAERRMLQRQNSLSTEGLQRVGHLKTVFKW